MRTNLAFALAAVSFGLPGAAHADAVPGLTPIPACTASRLSAATDGERGAFDGTSHGGTLLVVRNVSGSPCGLSPFAAVTFADRNGKQVEIVIDRPTPFESPLANGRRLPMGHGPVVLPIVLAGGAEATAPVRWVSSPVFDGGVCVDVASLAVAVGGVTLRTPGIDRMCGADRGHVDVTISPFALDPVYRP